MWIIFLNICKILNYIATFRLAYSAWEILPASLSLLFSKMQANTMFNSSSTSPKIFPYRHRGSQYSVTLGLALRSLNSVTLQYVQYLNIAVMSRHLPKLCEFHSVPCQESIA